jgi:hypothetical protein
MMFCSKKKSKLEEGASIRSLRMRDDCRYEERFSTYLLREHS